jgi:hypothetical protein
MTLHEDLEQLQLLLEKIYIETKNDKFLNDAIALEQWIWTLSDKLKKDLGINLEGSHTSINVLNRLKKID